MMMRVWTWMTAGALLCASAVASAGPLAVPVDGSHRAEVRVVPPKPAPRGWIDVTNLSNRSMFVDVEGQSFWLGPWQTTALHVRAGIVELDASMTRNGRLVPVQTRLVQIDPGQRASVELVRPRRVVHWGIAYREPTVSIRWSPWLYGHHGHHGHHRSRHH